MEPHGPNPVDLAPIPAGVVAPPVVRRIVGSRTSAEEMASTAEAIYSSQRITPVG